ncbi:uncharacterized protein LOC126749918 [Anthonomus grandis grandis]|uniref:uncharacterized protein LOC126749918 n=1 Tax=Anthonomus grandis grandis TaxID=2921223 RepID=UPI00216630C8|nr:uncharacterized protein LOC126749918 [Anthonomus grandis grandis]
MRGQNPVVLTSYIYGDEDAENIVNIFQTFKVRVNEIDMSQDTAAMDTKTETSLDLSEDVQHGSGSEALKHRDLLKWLKRQTKKTFSVKTLKRRIPIFNYLPQYTWEIALSDFLAGITVGLTIIPQAIAYSNVAGLPAQIDIGKSACDKLGSIRRS